MTENRPGAPAPGVNTPPQERSTTGRSSVAGEEHVRSEEQWEERLRAAVEKTLRERARKKAERLEFQTRRNHGLAARHAAKLARIKEKTMELTPEQQRTEDVFNSALESDVAARKLIGEWISTGLLIRLTNGALIETDRYDPTIHGPVVTRP